MVCIFPIFIFNKNIKLIQKYVWLEFVENIELPAYYVGLSAPVTLLKTLVTLLKMLITLYSMLITLRKMLIRHEVDKNECPCYCNIEKYTFKGIIQRKISSLFNNNVR